ncbi:hypothetical protein LSUB1_G001906 [Lachnellula subtilissima]|uniref:DUF5672 domain-containing protein n=1 Tax=Lachnellula subtilissima TaxID=602034 RepID=A0A8H8UHI0_9HELO|nr:hypothetical protein LSUB1_G001906 [Lachnellula subtilissima]
MAGFTKGFNFENESSRSWLILGKKWFFVFCSVSLLALIWIVTLSIQSHSTPDFSSITLSSSIPEESITPETSPTSSFQPSASPTSSSAVAVLTTAKNVAAIVETRPLDTLVPLFLHFSTVLGPEWPIHIFTTQSTIPASIPLKRAIASKHIIFRYLPPNTQFKDHKEVSQFLTEPWLWEALAPAERVLFFQADSILCANAPMRVDDFLEYDFVGAPINPDLPADDEGMNGGLSLRNRQMTLDIIAASSWIDELTNATNDDPKLAYEDQWFYHKMKALGANLPDVETANKFSVETMWYDTPVGFHKIASWNMDRVKEIDQYCPEHRLATNLPIPEIVG